MHRTIATVVIVVAVIAIRFFTVDAGDVVKFNDDMVDLGGEFIDNYQSFKQQLDTYTDGQTVDAASLKQALADAQSRSQPIVEKIKGYSVPDNELCRNFHKSTVEFTDAYAAHQEMFDSIVTYVEAHSEPTDDDINHVMELMKPFQTELVLKLMTMDEAQKTMCDKYDITLQ